MMCVVCGGNLTGRQNKYCSQRCASRAFNRVRVADGRLFAQRAARAEKIREYNQATRSRWYHERVCEICGETWRARREDSRFCSSLCRSVGLTGPPACEVPETHPARSCPIPSDHPARAALCPWCLGEYHRQHPQQMYCTPHCQRTAHWHRRDRRVREAYVAHVVPARIYERDRWRCHICGKRISRTARAPHPRSPSLDHVVPLAQGGTHEPANIRAAHFRCNALRQTGGGGEQLWLVG